MAKLDQFKEDFATFVELSLIAIKQGDEANARKLLKAVSLLDPKTSLEEMGYGLIALHKMKLNEAEKHFKKVLEIEPQNRRAQAFLGFSYILTAFEKDVPSDKKKDNLVKGAELAKEVADNAEEISTKELAESLISWEKELAEKTPPKMR